MAKFKEDKDIEKLIKLIDEQNDLLIELTVEELELLNEYLDRKKKFLLDENEE